MLPKHIDLQSSWGNEEKSQNFLKWSVYEVDKSYLSRHRTLIYVLQYLHLYTSTWHYISTWLSQYLSVVHHLHEVGHAHELLILAVDYVVIATELKGQGWRAKVHDGSSETVARSYRVRVDDPSGNLYKDVNYYFSN